MRAVRNPARARASRLTAVRALVVSLALHAAAAAAYGGYHLGGYADAPPSLDLGGGTFIAISIRGEPGGAAPGGPTADVVANVDAAEPPLVAEASVPPPPVAPPEPEPEPTFPPEPLPEPRLVQPPAVIAVLDVAAPAIADLAAEVGRDVAAVVEASVEHVRRQQYAPPPRPALSQPPGAGLVGARGGGAGEDQGAGEGDSPAGDGSGDGGGGGLGVGRNPPPEYPQAARLAGQEGVVIVLMLCDATGAVQDAWVEESSGYPLLDEAALAAVRKWTFVPAVQGGVAVAGYVRRPISFTLAR